MNETYKIIGEYSSTPTEIQKITNINGLIDQESEKALSNVKIRAADAAAATELGTSRILVRDSQSLFT